MITAQGEETAITIKSKISAVIGDRHPTETADWWRGLGPEAPTIIIAMYKENQITHQRIRLLQALAWFDSEEATEFLKSTVQESSNRMIRGAALKTVALSQGDKELEFIGSYLGDGEAHTRLQAANALEKMKKNLSEEGADPKSLSRIDDLLKGFEGTETKPWVLAKFQKNRDQLSKKTDTKNAGKRLPKKVQVPLTPQSRAGRQTGQAIEKIQGSWVGKWLVPEKKPGVNFATENLSLTIKKKDGVLDGVLVHGPKGEHKIKINDLRFKSFDFSGSLHKEVGLLFKTTEKHPFEGSLREEVGHHIVRLKIPTIGASVVARKKN